MTTGSLVVLLEGGPPASLGTASPTSCNEGSRYIATRGVEGEKKRMGGGEEDRVRRKGEEEESTVHWEERTRRKGYRIGERKRREEQKRVKRKESIQEEKGVSLLYDPINLKERKN